MGFEHKSSTEIFKIANIPVGTHVFFNDVLGSKDPEIANPIVGAWFRIEKGPASAPPKYEYDEVGIVVQGEITLKDETGQERTLGPNDTFVVYRGSTIQFSTKSYGVAWKCGSRPLEKL